MTIQIKAIEQGLHVVLQGYLINFQYPKKLWKKFLVSDPDSNEIVCGVHSCGFVHYALK